MKLNKYLLFLLIFWSFMACQKENIQRNPFLQEAKFTKRINLRLPQYIKLTQDNTSIVIDDVGLRGIVVSHIFGNYLAWERACPSQPLSECSQMELKDNFTVHCPCNNQLYHLSNGQPLNGSSPYPLLNYQVVVNGNMLTISN